MRVFKDASTREKYYVDYFFHGRRVRYFAGSSLRAAETLRIRIESEINAGVHDPDKVRRDVKGIQHPGLSIGELTRHFLKVYRSRGNSDYYAQRVKAIIGYFGTGKQVADITPLQVEEFRNSLSDQALGPATVRKTLIALGTIFRWAITKNLVKENPADPIKVKRPSEPPHREVYLSDEQVTMLLKECNPTLRRLVHFLLETGMSLGQPLTLKWSDLDANTGWIYVERGKTGKAWKIPYTDLLKSIVESRPRRIHSEFVFPDSKTRTPKQYANELSKDIKAAMVKIGLQDASAHSLRHTFASRLINRGVHTKIIAELLGHSEASVTARYTHLTGETIQRTMRQIQDGQSQQEDPADGQKPDAGRVPGGS